MLCCRRVFAIGTPASRSQKVMRGGTKRHPSTGVAAAEQPRLLISAVARARNHRYQMRSSLRWI
jgi:hypothetical protein